LLFIYATTKIEDLYVASQFFRDALADERLKPAAEAIFEKKIRHEKDPSFDYPVWQMQDDMTNLKQQAIQLGATAGYDDDLLQNIESKPQPEGFLIYYYSTSKRL